MRHLTSIVFSSILLTGLAFSVAQAAEIESGDVRIQYLFSLANFNGTIPYSDVRLHVDEARDEIYAAFGNDVRVFNGVGMEEYRFDFPNDLGSIRGIVALESGDLVVLTYDLGSPGRPWTLTRSDYRGEPIEPIELRGLPEGFMGFDPNRMFYRAGRIYLVSRSQLRVVVIDLTGEVRRIHDLAELLEIDDAGAEEVFGFSVAPDGDMLFTIPVRFRAYVVSPDQTVREFGSAGSAPGKFGIVSGIVRTDSGHYLIADKLRYVVMVFDSSFQFVTEFDSAGGREELARPSELARGPNDKFYVTQSRNRGVATYRLKETGARQLAELGVFTEGGDHEGAKPTLTLVADKNLDVPGSK